MLSPINGKCNQHLNLKRFVFILFGNLSLSGVLRNEPIVDHNSRLKSQEKLMLLAQDNEFEDTCTCIVFFLLAALKISLISSSSKINENYTPNQCHKNIWHF